MKTATSIPDGLFERAEQTAQRLGLARSQLFAKAIEEYIKNHHQETITTQLNMVYSTVESSDAIETDRI